MVVDLSPGRKVEAVLIWGEKNRIRVLNVAGPRESDNPGIYDLTVRFLKNLLIKNKPPGQSKGCGGSKKTGVGGYQ
jgi:hypothetical protein